MLNHKVQTERRQEEIWQSNSQIILMLPLNKLTNAATLHKKREKEKYSEGRMSRTDRQAVEQTDRQTVEQTDSQTDRQLSLVMLLLLLVFKSTFMSTELYTTSICLSGKWQGVAGGRAQGQWQCATVAQQTYSTHFTVA